MLSNILSDSKFDAKSVGSTVVHRDSMVRDSASEQIMTCIAEGLQRLHKNGMSVTSMAESTGIPRPIMSELKNGSYHNSVNLDRVVELLNLCGYELAVKRRKLKEVSNGVAAPKKKYGQRSS